MERVNDSGFPYSSLSGERYSKCAEESRRAQLERIRAMAPLARMAAALALGRRHRDLDRERAKPAGGVR